MQLRFWANEEEYGKSGTWVLSRIGQINFMQEQFAQIRPVLREKHSYLSMIFLDFLLQPSSKLSQLQIQIRLAVVERWMEIYFVVDQLVRNNPILLWEIIFSILFLLFLIIKGEHVLCIGKQWGMNGRDGEISCCNYTIPHRLSLIKQRSTVCKHCYAWLIQEHVSI